MMDETAKISQLYRCEGCGLESTVKEAFIIKKSTLGGRNKTLCFECATKQQFNLLIIEFLAFLLVGLCFFLNTSLRWAGMFLLLFCEGLLLFLPLALLHELAHTAMARLVGFQVFGIHLGAGKVFFTRRIMGIRWYLRPMPIGAVTIVSGPELSHYRVRRFLILLAGPGLHAMLVAMLAVVLPFLRNGQPISLAYTAAQLGMYTNLYLLLINLYPRKMAASTGVAGTDGWAILHLVHQKPDELRKQFSTYYMLKAIDAIDLDDDPSARQWIEEGLKLYPNDLNLINTAGFVYSNTNQFEKARAAFVRVLESKEGLTEGVKYIAMNNVAYADIMLEDPAYLAEADEYSALAQKNLPWVSLIDGTRGAVLVSLGQVAEGIALLKNSMSHSFDRHERASDACLIARGEWKLGNQGQARQYLQTARQLDPHCPLLERIEEEVGC